MAMRSISLENHFIANETFLSLSPPTIWSFRLKFYWFSFGCASCRFVWSDLCASQSYWDEVLMVLWEAYVLFDSQNSFFVCSLYKSPISHIYQYNCFAVRLVLTKMHALKVIISASAMTCDWKCYLNEIQHANSIFLTPKGILPAEVLDAFSINFNVIPLAYQRSLSCLCSHFKRGFMKTWVIKSEYHRTFRIG